MAPDSRFWGYVSVTSVQLDRDVVEGGELGEGVLARGRSASLVELANRAEWIRLETIKLIDQAGFGHYSSTFSSAEIFSVLYYHSLRLKPSDPEWADRDRFLLGKGHIAVGLWSIFADLGFYPKSWLDEYGKIDSPITDHPQMLPVPGVDFSSGSLGHNLSVGVGIALAGRIQERDFRTYVVTGDGELQEGQIWEAAMSAGHYGLSNLVAIVDANGFSGGGATSKTMNIEPLADRFTSFGWRVVEINGTDVAALVDTFDGIPADGTKPTCVIARTHKGAGVKLMEAAPQAWHMGWLKGDDLTQAVTEIEARIQ
jgi:transketolase